MLKLICLSNKTITKFYGAFIKFHATHSPPNDNSPKMIRQSASESKCFAPPRRL